MKEINATFTKKTKLVETKGTKLNVKSEMETLFVLLSLDIRRGLREEIWPLEVLYSFTVAVGSPP